MTLLKAATHLTEANARIGTCEQGKDLLKALDHRQTLLGKELEGIQEPAAFISLLRRRSLPVASLLSPETLEGARAALMAVWQDGELDEDVLFGDDFYRARKIVRDALGVLEVQAKDSWKDIVREHDPGMADDLLDALEAIPRFRSTIRTLRQRQQNLTRLAGESWVTSKELDRYFKLVDEVKETWGTLEAGEGSIPDEVIRFLKQCSAGGAPLDMLTDVVTSWIADRNLDEYFSVRIGASRTPWSGA